MLQEWSQLYFHEVFCILNEIFLPFRDVYSTFTNTVINRIFGHLCGRVFVFEGEKTPKEDKARD